MHTRDKKIGIFGVRRLRLCMPIFSAIFGISLLFQLAAPVVSSALSTEVTLSSGRQVVVEQVMAESKTSRWIVLIPGSGCGLFHLKGSIFLNTLRAHFPLNVLVVNKAGVNLKNECDTLEFNLGSLRENRIQDINEALYQFLPKDSKTILMGESEGAYLVPDIALKLENKVIAAITLSGGTQSWLEEEVMMSPEAERDQVRKFIEEEVIGSQDLNQTFRGWTYAQLNSFSTSQSFKSIQALSIPVLSLFGEKDHLIWVEGNIANLKKLIEEENKKNIRYHVIPNGNHGLYCAGGLDPNCPTRPAQDLACDELLDFTRQLKF